MKSGLVAGVLVTGLALAGAMATDAPANSANTGLAKMKAGPITFRILDAAGIRPQVDSTVAVAASEDGKMVGSGKTDAAGRCVLTLASGRYILSVNDVNLAVLLASDDATLSECKILMPSAPLAVGGQDPAGTPPPQQQEVRRGGAWWFYAGGAAVLVVGGTTYWYLDEEHRKDKKDDKKKVSK
jgi:hypothetical protein